MRDSIDGMLLRHLVAFVLLALLFLYTYLHEFVDVSPLIFWLLWVMIISNAFITLVRARSSAEQLLTLLVVLAAILLTKTPASYWPFQLRGTDDYFELNLAKTIAETGRWDPTAGLGFATDYYGYLPGVHLLIAELTIVLGANGAWGAFMLGKYLYIPVMSFVTMLLAFMIVRVCCRGFFDQGFLGIAMLLYLSTLGILVIHAGRATFGDLFMLMVFYLFVKQLVEGRTRTNVILLILAVMGLAIGYHFSQYYLVLVLALAIPFLSRSKVSTASQTQWLAIVAIGTLSWELFVGSTVFHRDWFGYVNALLGLLLHGEVSSIPSTFAYNAFERFLPYFSQAILVGSAILGLTTLFKRRLSPKFERTPSLAILKFIAAFGLATHIITGPLIITSFFFFTYVTAVFSGLGVSILACLGLLVVLNVKPASESRAPTAPRWSIADAVGLDQGHMQKKALLPMLLLVIIFSGNLLIVFSARTLDRGPQDLATVEDVRNMKPEFASAGLWLHSHSSQGATILGDRPVWEVFGGYLSINVFQDAYLLANTQALQEGRGQFDFVVVDQNLGKYTSEFNPSLFPSPLTELHSPGLNRIYSNGLISTLTFVAVE